MTIFHVIKYYPRGSFSDTIFWSDLVFLKEALPELYTPWAVNIPVRMDILKKLLLEYEEP